MVGKYWNRRHRIDDLGYVCSLSFSAWSGAAPIEAKVWFGVNIVEF